MQEAGPFDCEPSGQKAQAHEPSVVLTSPGPQDSQVMPLELNVPAGQGTQAVLSLLGTVPQGQGTQLVAPKTSLIVPLGHS